MSSAYPTDHSSRSWWPLSKPSNKDLRRQYAAEKSTSGRNFPSFASVIGLKSSKKHPTLTIEDPPPSLRSYPSHSKQYHYRARQDFIPLSPADSLPPVTPLDAPRDSRHQSLLTLSDTDPFAGRGILQVHPSDAQRLSGHSSNSFLDVSQKQDKASRLLRGSYSSSSSNSHSSNQEKPSRKANNATTDARSLTTSKSISNLSGKKDHNVSASVLPFPSPPLISESHSQPNSRPPTRSRGMTESSSARPPFLQEDRPNSRLPHVSLGGRSPSIPHSRPSSANQPSSSVARPSSTGHPSSANKNITATAHLYPGQLPRSVVRQTSKQRLGLPPSAPPAAELPAPPSLPEEPTFVAEVDILPTCGSPVSSSLSFASSSSYAMDIVYGYHEGLKKRDKKGSLDMPLDDFNSNVEGTNSASSHSKSHHSPRSLKKVLSHSSLTKRPPPLPIQATISEGTSQVEKTPRKQRSYHRLGLPPLPLSFRHGHTPSAGTPGPPQVTENPTSVELKRGSTTSHTSVSVRKRVFSGSSSRRPSTSTGVLPTEDDSRSLFSLRSDQDIFFGSSHKPWPIHMSASGSFWDENPDIQNIPQSPVQSIQSDWTPQRIMSPEELARVEAGIIDGSIPITPPPVSPPRIRQRVISAASTLLSDRDSEIVPPSLFSSWMSEHAQSPQTPGSVVGTTEVPPSPTLSRSMSLASKPSTMSPRPSHRPSTASGITPSVMMSMSTIHEPEGWDGTHSTINGTIEDDTNSVSSQKPARKKRIDDSQPMRIQRSLPPPPRPRQKAQVITEATPDEYIYSSACSENTKVEVDFAHSNYTQYPSDSYSHTRPPTQPPLSHPYRGPPPSSLRYKQATKKPSRQSLLRKPSFLDIDDDDTDNLVTSRSRSPMKKRIGGAIGTLVRANSHAESFLEIEKESFDTVRSGFGYRR